MFPVEDGPLTAERCRVCKCTEREPCNPPCSWASAGLCSSCYELSRLLREWIDNVALKPRVAALVKLARELEDGDLRKRR